MNDWRQFLNAINHDGRGPIVDAHSLKMYSDVVRAATEILRDDLRPAPDQEIEHHLQLGVELKASFQRLSATGIVAAERRLASSRPGHARGLAKSRSLQTATNPPIILAGLEQRTSLPESFVAAATHCDQI